jgi:hypothetical protein
MTNAKKAAPAAKPVSTPKPPKKLVPRPAPEPAAAALGGEVPPVPVPEVALPATAAAAAKVRPPRQRSREDETVARHRKVLADALVKAQAINYDQPKVMKQPAPLGKKAAKHEKPVKAKKPKLIRDGYAMPEAEFARIGELKKRLAALGHEVKKSELLRGGIALLTTLGDAELKAAMARVERIKTGRPAK